MRPREVGPSDWEAAALWTALILAAWVLMTAVILVSRLQASGCQLQPIGVPEPVDTPPIVVPKGP
jgi:hypothetical protein